MLIICVFPIVVIKRVLQKVPVIIMDLIPFALSYTFLSSCNVLLLLINLELLCFPCYHFIILHMVISFSYFSHFLLLYFYWN